MACLLLCSIALSGLVVLGMDGGFVTGRSTVATADVFLQATVMQSMSDFWEKLDHDYDSELLKHQRASMEYVAAHRDNVAPRFRRPAARMSSDLGLWLDTGRRARVHGADAAAQRALRKHDTDVSAGSTLDPSGVGLWFHKLGHIFSFLPCSPCVLVFSTDWYAILLVLCTGFLAGVGLNPAYFGLKQLAGCCRFNIAG